MKKNRIKDILDLLRIILLILTAIIIKFVDSIIITLLLIILLVVLSIIERTFWRCHKCGEYLPRKSWFNNVLCCPYCKADIEEKRINNI